MPPRTIELNEQDAEVVSEVLEQLEGYYRALARFVPGEAILNLALWRPSDVRDHPDRERVLSEVAARLSSIREGIRGQLTSA